jgi:hypothetical protein
MPHRHSSRRGGHRFIHDTGGKEFLISGQLDTADRLHPDQLIVLLRALCVYADFCGLIDRWPAVCVHTDFAQAGPVHLIDPVSFHGEVAARGIYAWAVYGEFHRHCRPCWAKQDRTILQLTDLLDSTEQPPATAVAETVLHELLHHSFHQLQGLDHSPTALAASEPVIDYLTGHHLRAFNARYDLLPPL